MKHEKLCFSPKTEDFRGLQAMKRARQLTDNGKTPLQIFTLAKIKLTQTHPPPLKLHYWSKKDSVSHRPFQQKTCKIGRG